DGVKFEVSQLYLSAFCLLPSAFCLAPTKITKSCQDPHCGFINPLVKDLKLREWTCPTCSNYNLRDNNAALNILGEGLKLLIAAVGAPDALNAYGESVSPGVIQAGLVEVGIP
ncbi:transposase, partial [Nostoc parmelioides]|uniref:transposase n=1 Tax=Nostoc parmelioides TaxID=1521621 RepID=UPI001F557312